MEDPIETNEQGERRKARRTANACQPCRQSKIKCSGDDPCQNCKRRSIRCHFAEGGNKIIVSEKYLQQLQKQAGENLRSPSASNPESPTRAECQYRSPVTRPSPSTQSRGPSPVPRMATSQGVPSMRRRCSTNSTFTYNRNASDSGVDTSLVSPAPTIDVSQRPEISSGPATVPEYHHVNSSLRVWSNPFITPSKIIKNTCRNRRTWIWLAPWSTWSFTIRLMLMLREKLHPEDPSIPSCLIDPDLWTLTWRTSSSDLPDFSGLPSVEHAIFLLNTVKFHIGQTYRFFNESEMESQIRNFYSNALHKAGECRLWFVKFLLILAFGTAFQAPPTTSQEPPGAKFFTRAMGLLPDPSSLWKDSILAIEVLALVGLYLFSIDERESAYLYLGQAVHIALFEGLHTQLPEHDLGVETVGTCRDLWWTLYLMDRHFSSSVGLPMSVQDSDITTPVNPPNSGSRGESFRTLQVNLSHLLSVILTTVYKPKITPLATFLEQTRSILHTLAHQAQEIERIVCLMQNSVGTMPRDTRHLTLMYHQCVIVATRPLLLSVLKERLDTLGYPGDENCETFLAQTGTVISIGIKSAAKSLRILTSEYSLLEAFLPYDVEFTFGAALHLTMANAIFPGIFDYQSCRQLAHQTLDGLISRGNRVARARQLELCHLEILYQELAAKTQQQGHQMLHLFCPEGTIVDPMRRENQDHSRVLMTENDPTTLTAAADPGHPLHPLNPHVTSNMEFLDNIGISSEEFLSIVQEIGDPGTLPENMLTLV
ncbi:fungal-specific transcription factor domain-containing protein [Hypoxylon trugodes]|uniref:fungal-specific transcription factor domain-containing protein n=1 Tax=Hypoxylon trugodes TaxID=326681 RepID=UPI0021A1A42E|nr:fungal-specific transcription factor domain-containing protein [Hypoxylon trugodes]KAI1394410.1 fungal-specific transcription factor domain-containing protein [Hypoxylon trugodes]